MEKEFFIDLNVDNINDINLQKELKSECVTKILINKEKQTYRFYSDNITKLRNFIMRHWEDIDLIANIEIRIVEKVNKTILEEADNIVNNRSEEKDRQYGSFPVGMERAALIASGFAGKKWTAEDIYIALIALKGSRRSFNYKRDNDLDGVAYWGALSNYIENELNGIEHDPELKDWENNKQCEEK